MVAARAGGGAAGAATGTAGGAAGACCACAAAASEGGDPASLSSSSLPPRETRRGRCAGRGAVPPVPGRFRVGAGAAPAPRRDVRAPRAPDRGLAVEAYLPPAPLLRERHDDAGRAAHGDVVADGQVLVVLAGRRRGHRGVSVLASRRRLGGPPALLFRRRRLLVGGGHASSSAAGDLRGRPRSVRADILVVRVLRRLFFNGS